MGKSRLRLVQLVQDHPAGSGRGETAILFVSKRIVSFSEFGGHFVYSVVQIRDYMGFTLLS